MSIYTVRAGFPKSPPDRSKRLQALLGIPDRPGLSFLPGMVHIPPQRAGVYPVSEDLLADGLLLGAGVGLGQQGACQAASPVAVPVIDTLDRGGRDATRLAFFHHAGENARAHLQGGGQAGKKVRGRQAFPRLITGEFGGRDVALGCDLGKAFEHDQPASVEKAGKVQGGESPFRL